MTIHELIARLQEEADDDPDVLVECYNIAGDADFVGGLEIYTAHGKRRVLITTDETE
jgi:hypothetical protein